MRIRTLAFAALILAACGSSPEDPRESTLRVGFGETVTIPGTTTQVTFSDVNDSRCPASVVCAWAGDAAVQLRSGNDNVTLHTNTSAGPSSSQLQGWRVTLADVQPQRLTTDPPPKTQYSAALHFSR